MQACCPWQNAIDRFVSTSDKISSSIHLSYTKMFIIYHHFLHDGKRTLALHENIYWINKIYAQLRHSLSVQYISPISAPLRSMLWIIWSAVTLAWIGLESHWKHPWMRKTARNPMNLSKVYLYIGRIWKKFIFVYLQCWFFQNF